MEDVGGIVYHVDMDTAAVTKGADRVNVALDNLNSGFGKVDAGAKGAERSIDNTGTSLVDLGKDAKGATTGVNTTGAALVDLGKDAKGATAGVGAADKAVTDLGKDAGTASTNLRKFGDAQSKGASSASGFGFALKPLAGLVAGVISVQALKQVGELAEQFTLLQSRIQRLSPDLATASKTYQSLLGIAGQTGQTLPATVKLWETLTSSLKSLGATNSEVVTLTGTLQKIGKIGGSSAEETANALRQLGQSLAGGTLRAEEYNSIVEQTPELVRQLASASGMSMGQFRQAMLDGKITSQQLFDLLLSRVPAVDAEFQKLPRSASDAGNAVTVAFGAAVSKLDQALGASQKLAKALDALAGNINNIAGNLSGQEKLNALLEDQADIQRQIDFQNQRTFGPSKARLQELIDLQGKNRDEIELTRKSMSASVTTKSSETRKAPVETTEGQKVIIQLGEQNAQMRAQGEERAKIIALQKLGTGATQQERDLAVALAIDTYRLQEAEKQRTKSKAEGISTAKKAQNELQQQIIKDAAEEKRATEANEKAIKSLADKLAEAGLKGQDLAEYQARLSLNEYATPEQIATVKQLADALYKVQEAKANKELLGQVDPIAGEQQKYELQLANYQKLNDAKLLSDQRYNELKLQADTEHEAALTGLQEERFRQQSKGNDLLIGTLNQLQDASAQAFVGLVSGATSGQDAVKALAGAILNEAVSAVVAFGFAQLKSLLIGQTAGAAAAGASIAEAGGVAAAWAPAAAASSVATLGGAAGIGLSALSAIVPAALSLFGGGRAYGGPVDASKMYRVNETGAPEIFNAAGGKQYMMPNIRGEVLSNKDATAGGGAGAAPVINIHEAAPGSSAKATYSQADERWVIDVVNGNMQTGGKLGKTTNQITGTRRKGS